MPDPSHTASSDRPLRPPAVTLGLSYLVAIVMLGPLLGSSADASTAFVDHFDSSANRVRDLIGALLLLVAAVSVGWTVAAARSDTSPAETVVRDASAVSGIVAATTLVVAAALLMTVPLTASIGELTDDPGITSDVQAGIAQTGTVVLLVGALCLGLTGVLLARLGRNSNAVPRRLGVAAWVVAATNCLGVTVVLLVPFAAWSIALGLVWSKARPLPAGVATTRE